MGATSSFEGLVAEAATRPQMARKTSKAFIAGALLRQSSERPVGSALASAAPCLRFCQATSFVMKGKERKSDEGAAEPTCKSGSVSRSAESAESCATLDPGLHGSSPHCIILALYITNVILQGLSLPAGLPYILCNALCSSVVDGAKMSCPWSAKCLCA